MHGTIMASALFMLFSGGTSVISRSMTGINVDRATTALSSSAFLTSAVMVVSGSLFAQFVVQQMIDRVYDIQQPGGDAIYALVAAFVALTVLPGEYGRPLALGSTATAFRVVLNDFGVV
jgi:hypothetical protein